MDNVFVVMLNMLRSLSMNTSIMTTPELLPQEAQLAALGIPTQVPEAVVNASAQGVLPSFTKQDDRANCDRIEVEPAFPTFSLTANKSSKVC